jgi:hypothetical protein
VVGYVPLGFLLALSLHARGAVRHANHPWRAVLRATVAARHALSLAMEALQNYLPSRVPPTSTSA